jgi:cell division protein FtsL
MGEDLMPIEIHFEKHIINHTLIREADPKSHRDYVVVTALAAMFLFGLFVYGWQHYQWIQYGYRIQAAQKKKEQLTEIGQQFRLERASLRSVQRIDSLARQQLGMVVPAPGQLVTLRSDSQLMPPHQPAQTAQPLQAQVQAEPSAFAAKR